VFRLQVPTAANVCARSVCLLRLLRFVASEYRPLEGIECGFKSGEIMSK